VSTQQTDRFIYIVGEHQNAIIAESEEIFAFTSNTMQQIETEELATVIANVFAKGQFFPGPEEVVTSVIHELVGRDGNYRQATPETGKGQCTLITALKRLDGEISVKVTTIIPVQPDTLHIEEPEGFHALLLETLPDFQHVFTEEAYAPDSKIIAIIKEATLHHIHKKLH
jgi:hypothetical protein